MVVVVTRTSVGFERDHDVWLKVIDECRHLIDHCSMVQGLEHPTGQSSDPRVPRSAKRAIEDLVQAGRSQSREVWRLGKRVPCRHYQREKFICYDT